jgi:hypothetical protein
MELRREILITIGALVSLNLLLAFGAIGLFVRMGPAIDRILEENVLSIVAAEEMLAELAAHEPALLAPEVRARVRQSLDRAQLNVTEEAERPILAAIEGQLADAMDGSVSARAAMIREVRRLILINREAMNDADKEARRLGIAGAWAAVLVGFGSFMLSVFVVVRLQSRFVRPLEELYQVLEDARGGVRLRRCRTREAPREVVQIARSVNKLLDERLDLTPRRQPLPPSAAP